MNWSKVGEIAGQTLPVLGSLLLGPGAGTIGTLIAGALGVKSDPAEVLAAMQTPQGMAELKRWTMQHREKLEALAIDRLQLELADTQNARAEHKHSRMPAVVTVALTAIVAVLLYMLFKSELPGSNREVAYMLFGQASALWGASVTYWVGTTRSSAEKDRRNLTKN